MDARGFSRLRWPLTLAVALCYTSLLVWQQLHAGVPGHSFLAREDMPAISNWWGTLVLPALTFLTAERLRARLEKGGRDPGVGAHHTGAHLGVAAAAFGGALLFGAALAVSFATGHANISALLFQSLLVIGLLLPIYRAEYVLGFVLGDDAHLRRGLADVRRDGDGDAVTSAASDGTARILVAHGACGEPRTGRLNRVIVRRDPLAATA